MTMNSSRPQPRRNAQRTVSPALTPATARIVWLRIAFSARYPSAVSAADLRLCARLRNSGFGCWMNDRAVALLGEQRAITPADWSALIGWLLCQPEVVFVAREFPRTQRIEVRP